MFASVLFLIGQLCEHPDTQYHDEQTNGDDDEQGETEPAHDDGACADARLDAAVAEVLRYDGRGHGGGVLPEDGYEDEDRGDEDDGQGDLRHGTAGERLDLALGTLAVLLLVPTGKSSEQQEADEGEDDSDNEQVGEDDHVLELAGQPDEVQRVLVD